MAGAENRARSRKVATALTGNEGTGEVAGIVTRQRGRAASEDMRAASEDMRSASILPRLAARLALGALALAATTWAAESVTPTDAETAFATTLGQAVNAYRATRGLPKLEADASLAKLAAAHSAKMASTGKLDHDGFQDRVRQSGFPLCVENVGWNYRSAQAQLDAWRRSPGHDENMRRTNLERAGVANVHGYVTWIACGP